MGDIKKSFSKTSLLGTSKTTGSHVAKLRPKKLAKLDTKGGADAGRGLCSSRGQHCKVDLQAAVQDEDREVPSQSVRISVCGSGFDPKKKHVEIGFSIACPIMYVLAVLHYMDDHGCTWRGSCELSRFCFAPICSSSLKHARGFFSGASVPSTSFGSLWANWSSA